MCQSLLQLPDGFKRVVDAYIFEVRQAVKSQVIVRRFPAFGLRRLVLYAQFAEVGQGVAQVMCTGATDGDVVVSR